MINYISTQSSNILFTLVATSSGHYGHHRSNIIQKLKPAGYFGAQKC